MAKAPDPVCLVDAHVHLHAVFDLPAFLEGAHRNFERAGSELGVEVACGVLLLAEGRGEGAFARLTEVKEAAVGGWESFPTAEADSIRMERHADTPVVCIAGHQLVSAEGIEVLALAVRDRPAEGVPVTDLIQLVRQSGGVPVLPWGFGKWLGRRGQLVASAVRSNVRVFLGDNAGRLARPKPAFLTDTMGWSVVVLPGSDPLPFIDQQERAGSSGFVAPVHLGHERPASELRGWLDTLDSQPRTWARFTSPASFLWNQARMHWRKRVTGSR